MLCGGGWRVGRQFNAEGAKGREDRQEDWNGRFAGFVCLRALCVELLPAARALEPIEVGLGLRYTPPPAWAVVAEW